MNLDIRAFKYPITIGELEKLIIENQYLADDLKTWKRLWSIGRNLERAWAEAATALRQAIDNPSLVEDAIKKFEYAVDLFTAAGES